MLPVNPRSACLDEHPVEQFRCDGVHGLVALDVVLHRDPRVSVPEQLRGKEYALRVVDDGGDGAG